MTRKAKITVTIALMLGMSPVQQTLNVTLEAAYTHVFVSIEALTWVRSISVVLIIVAHSMRHVQIAKPQGEPLAAAQEPQPPQLVITPDLIETLRGLLTHSTVTEEQPAPTLLLPKGDTQENNDERVRAYLSEHPTATLREIAEALTISVTTANKWRTRIQGEEKKETAKKRKK